MIILFNNKFISKDMAKISMLSNSFMYGYGAFETLRTYETKPFQSKEHIQRLFKSLKALELKPRYSAYEIEKMLIKVTKKCGLPNQRIKIVAIKEGIFISSTALIINKKLSNGVKCLVTEQRRSLPELKSLAYLDSYLAHQKALAKNCHDAILIDEKEEVYEGAYSSLFWFDGNTLCTRKDQILQGITRETILKISPFKIHFKNIKLKDLLKKKEIFLSQSTSGILPVIQIDKQKIANGEPGKNTLKLINLFRQHVAASQKNAVKQPVKPK